MKRSAVVGCAILLCGELLSASTICVSPGGSDRNAGTKDRPLATLEAARDAARRLKDAGTVIEIADGVYRLDRPITLAAQDSGTIWRAEHRGGAILSGSVKPVRYGRVEAPEILEKLPACARGKVVYAEFPETIKLPGFCGGACMPTKLRETPVSVFQGERRLVPARWPDEGFARTGRNVGKVEQRHDAAFCKTGVFAFESDRLARWAKEADLWAYGLWCYEWADAKVRVLEVDAEASTIAVDPAPIEFGIRERAQFYVMNALCELDRPGEWVLDRRSRRIYVWPVEGGGPLSFACATGLVRAAGARGVVFDGLVFDCARTDALKFENCSGCSVVASVVRRTSSWAIEMSGGVSNRVAGCDLYELGAGGVSLRGGVFETLTPGGHVADNNHIHHYGRVVPNYMPGVQLAGVGNRATHNLIHHTLHQAIAFDGNDHYIGWNVCHDLCMFNDDAGSIYCCQRDWTKRGTVIERNVIHMTGKQPRPTHTEAIYLDDFSSGVVVRHNIINRAAIGVYLGGGSDCQVYGNVILNCTYGLGLGSRGVETWSAYISKLGRKSENFRRLDALRPMLEGELWRSRYPNLLRVYDFEDAVFAHNALFNVFTNNVTAGCGQDEWQNWEKVAPYTVRTNNVSFASDPGFADYAHFDWELKPDSPAAKVVGRTAFAKMGLYASAERVSPPVKFGPDTPPPPAVMQRFDPATVRIDLQFIGKLPADVKRFASDLKRCDLPDWAKFSRVVADFGRASLTDWKEYSFSFTPQADGSLGFDIMGARGEKTLYDDLRVTGAEFPADGTFETSRGWQLPQPDPKDSRARMCNMAEPYGILDGRTAGFAPAEGRKMGCAHDVLRLSSTLKVRKGVPVTVTFKARAMDK